MLCDKQGASRIWFGVILQVRFLFILEKMIHTKYFTLLNYPKTGSTFLRNSVARTHRHVMGRRWSFIPKAFWPKFWYKEELKQHPTNNIIDQHGFRRTLNPNNKGVLITAIREPISWFTSSYKYQLWARSTNEWSKRFSNFPLPLTRRI